MRIKSTTELTRTGGTMDEPQSSTAPASQLPGQPTSQAEFGCLGHVLAFAICVGLPGFWTLAVPVSWVTLERHGEQVSAKAKVCLFFVVPYRNLTATGVTEVGTRISFPNTSNTTPRKGSPPDDEHFLIFRGDNGQSIEFPVADSSQDSLREKSAAFLQDPQATRLKFFAVSSWPLSIVGGFLSLLTLVYFLNAAVPLIHAVQRRCGVPPEKLFCAVSPEPTSTNSAPKPQG